MAQYDVIIVGAGVSGLSAARRLTKLGITKLILLEARENVGGRAETGKSKVLGAKVDLGASWVGVQQPNLLQLVDELRLRLVPQYENGENVIELANGTVLRWNGTLSELVTVSGMSEVGTIVEHLDHMSKAIDLNAPWSHPDAIDLDNQSVRSYLEQHVRNEDAREVYDKFVTLVTAVETTDLSVLDWLRFLKAGYGFSTVQNTSGGAQEARIVEGMQEIPIRLAESLGRGAVAFKNQVVNIKEENNGAYYTVRSVVTAQDGSTRTIRYTSRYVIVTLPPHLVGKIEFTPKLSLARRQLCMRAPMAATIKAYAFYKTPFWRNKGLNGFTMSTNGPVTQTYDVTDESGKNPCILMLINGWHARSVSQLSAEERKSIFAKHLVKLLGADEALHPIDYVEKNWLDEPFSDGCYGAAWLPGTLSIFGHAITKQHARGVFFAGSETAVEWAGYVEGAISSGYRAAQEVYEAFQRRSRRSRIQSKL